MEEVADLRDAITELERIVEETGNERAARLLQKFEGILSVEHSIEAFYQDDEIREFWENPGRFTHTVRTWMRDYRDKEME